VGVHKLGLHNAAERRQICSAMGRKNLTTSTR